MKIVDPDALAFLRDLTRNTVEASRVRPGQTVAGHTNTTGQTLIKPGGRDCYPAMWVRDFAMALDAGFIAPDEVHQHFELIARRQSSDKERRLKSGGIIPPWSIPDHINFDAAPVFYPGTMSPGDDQGGEPFGVLPPVCDHYYFVLAAAHYWPTRPNKLRALKQPFYGATLLDRLTAAFRAPRSDAETGCVTTQAGTRAVGFGFYDVVYLTGSLLFPTLLRWQSAGELARIFTGLGQGDEARACDAVRKTIPTHLLKVFSSPDRLGGWLMASTENGQQPDVWGTLYAHHLNLLPEDFRKLSVATIARAVRAGTITHAGAVRHLPTDHDHSPDSAWQQVAPGVPRGTYQNGAYWHTPTGWLVDALAHDEPDLARQIFNDYISHLRTEDFRKGKDFGAPWECFGKDNGHKQNPVYLASVAVPYAVLRDLHEKET